MILNYILLALILLLASLFILFIIYMLLPNSKGKKDSDDNAILSEDEVDFIKPQIDQIEITEKKAMVLCNCHKEFKIDRSLFNKEHTCYMINSDNGTGTDCKFSCIGLGDCVKACPQQAIKIVNHTAIITELCIGCGKCINSCPLHIITLVSKHKENVVLCANQDCEPTSCSALLKEEKVNWPDKKDFKIWKSCYKIFKNVIKS